ncbi:3-methylcrotonyl-CoA carboxylase alpha subunit [Herbaspirillum sp. Sphag1AN]|uniref:acetyl/propionyl/methylcrotonyl-CoA carboxylase subunit alpha n=1 Tax=unclassified Herbaspirillum TaxID=2624150 RepID=UPI00161ED901|nr:MULTISPECIES: acetyl/propionyl/methylcrotonyl-CoA carboxylase subunit alpha [unclassified Herbaspirillum]MBB3213611.1 3-methylcrotonyl-CoA carboxylase alpha subunit [Herbaspirillum sp. Sphag1AN]MBB3246809.1 3-methylcrotonyl-CoA carboxylase alpha subunit [Herbaspirillum sp. Sphag64]
MFEKILIANRGEIACRVAATARRMGIKTVAVYSEADAGAKHVTACDEAILIGPAAARESYLQAEKIIAVALATGAQAIHPGYGFLSENASFAQACADAGLIFIGPPASAITAMGSKSAAKALMAQAGVPLVPGYHGDNQDAELLQQEANRIGYPVLLKASAGGGGKGMRIVEHADDFKAALASCKREASNSFGDDKVLVEKYLTRPRHVEIQVFADQQGNTVHLFERDCSVQRRHQKVLEEAPAPGLGASRRQAMGEAAVAAARAVGYVGAGTVEFIVDCSADDGSADRGDFYFMEMNTRLQVEHPVTEMITGLDLVEWQLRVASGQNLPLRQEQLHIDGHAIEARIYAENPEKGFLPAIGRLHTLHTPSAVEFVVHSHAPGLTKAAVRIDSGVREGDAISPFYDPMIAKLIVWGADRQTALANMAAALAQYRIVGLATNITFLQRLISGHAFASADLDTGLIARHHDALFPSPQAASLATLALAVCALLTQERATSNEPWAQSTGWRMNSRLVRQLPLSDEASVYPLTVEYLDDRRWVLHAADQSYHLSLNQHDDSAWSITLDDQQIKGHVVRLEDDLHVFHQGRQHVLRWEDPLAHAGQSEAEGGRLTAPMPGKIVALLVTAGQEVKQGTPLLIMEAMKMEHTINAPADGVIDTLLYKIGDQVAEGTQLLGFTRT